jgi:hypothetical protein
MPMSTNTAEEQFNAADSLNLCLVGSIFFVELKSITIEDIDVLGIYIDVGKEIFEYKGVV